MVVKTNGRRRQAPGPEAEPEEPSNETDEAEEQEEDEVGTVRNDQEWQCQLQKFRVGHPREGKTCLWSS